MRQSIIKKISLAPHGPGIYVFYRNRQPIYIGKASDLKNRLSSYLKIQDTKTEALHQEATRLYYRPLRSEIEALIEEAKLIKNREPKYNVLWRDDKSYHYAAFTKEQFPKIFVTHKNPKRYTLAANGYDKIGPFTDGGTLRKSLHILRKYFPYCTCFQNHLRDCVNAQIGLCIGFCCTQRRPMQAIATDDQLKKYQRNIKIIKSFLLGQPIKLLKMNSNEQTVINKILEHKDFVRFEPIQEKNYTTHGHALIDVEKISRIECYDNSHFAGDHPYGAMIVLEKNERGEFQPRPDAFRLFKISRAFSQDDPRMIEEVLSRRLRHSEWQYPNFIIIDGGKTQFNAARRALASYGNLCDRIQIISFAKMSEKLHTHFSEMLLTELSMQEQLLVKKAIRYAHRFAIKTNRRMREKIFEPAKS